MNFYNNLYYFFGAMRVNGRKKNILNWNKRMNIYNKSIEFSKTEIIRQRQIEIEDFINELETAKIKYNEDYIKNLENNFQKWLEYDIEREKAMYI